MILGLRHTGIVVRDMKKALSFYQGLMGLSVIVDCVEKGPYIEKLVGVKKAILHIVKLRVASASSASREPRIAFDGVIELLQFLAPTAGHAAHSTGNRFGISHLAFAVENVDALYQEWSRKGILFNHPPQWSPDKSAKVAYARDPDGTVVEVVQMV